MNIENKDEREAFFKQLINECDKESVYSVIETVEKMGVSYKQLQELAKTDESIAESLDFCRMGCSCNAEIDGLYGKISEETFLKYNCENDDEFREYYEKQQAVELREKLEKEGKEIPPTQKERFLMIEAITKKPEQLVSANINENLPANSMLHQQTKEEIETERIKHWKERVKRETPCFKAKQNITEDEKEAKIISLMGDATSTERLSQDLIDATLCALSGSANPAFASNLIGQTISAYFLKPNENAEAIANIINGALLSLAPKDEIEGMLCSRLLVLHDQYMGFMSRVTSNDQTSPGVDLNINRATKLMRLWNETLDALSKHRRKGEQKVTVQHINVREGGQAIVNGQLNQGGGADDKK